jgi:putative oxidoreductase
MFAVAYFMMHVGPAATPVAKFFPIASAGAQYSNHGELAVMYCWIFFFMVFYGPGRWSVDALIARNRAVTTREGALA